MSCATPILPSGPLGHVPEMTGHVAEIPGHDPETAGHVHPKYAVSAAIGPAIVVCGLHWLAAVKRDKCVWVAASLALGLVIGRLAIVVVAKVHGFAISLNLRPSRISNGFRVTSH
ncbi:hypothetical protein, partial [Paraburkholderia sp. EG304]|uniref:hypothetical protein n=1 Tax=Paraburkholderia sp. EG304 TaxID=3237015 RepID=UPI003978D576